MSEMAAPTSAIEKKTKMIQPITRMKLAE